MTRLPLVAIAVGLALSTPAFAHKLIVNAAPKGSDLRVEAYYEDDTPADDAKVTLSQGDRVVAEGKTDDHGVWSCPLPAAGTYVVKVLSVGHAATTTVEIGTPAASDVGSSAVDAEKRAADTRTPWRRLGLGVGLILGVGVGWWLLRRHSHPHPHPEESL